MLLIGESSTQFSIKQHYLLRVYEKIQNQTEQNIIHNKGNRDTNTNRKYLSNLGMNQDKRFKRVKPAKYGRNLLIEMC